VWIDVIDNGPGIPLEHQSRIFEIGVSTKHPGRGRGLAIVRESVQVQGGQLEVESTPGRGSQFSIGLPEVDESDEAATGTARSAGPK
jgi:signal transduction histidine kinase